MNDRDDSDEANDIKIISTWPGLSYNSQISTILSFEDFHLKTHCFPAGWPWPWLVTLLDLIRFNDLYSTHINHLRSHEQELMLIWPVKKDRGPFPDNIIWTPGSKNATPWICKWPWINNLHEMSKLSCYWIMLSHIFIIWAILIKLNCLMKIHT